MRALFMQAPSAILVIDKDGMIVLANLQAHALFGYPNEDLNGRPLEDLVPTPAGAPCAWYQASRQALFDRGPAFVHELELMARRRDDDQFPAEISLAPLGPADGGLLSVAFRDITERKLADEALARQVHHDALTGLPNRVLFLERLQRALARAGRTGRPLAVVFIDLDDFKLVNDTRGHDAGDLLLKKLTPRLAAAVRAGDTVARLGGDEFVALCEDLSADTDAVMLAQRITDAVARPVQIRGVTHNVSVSTGVVLVRDSTEFTAHGVLRDADAAMYDAKAGGKGRVAVFDATMRAQLLERVAMEAALRSAVSAGELRLLYQPVVALEPGRVVAAEALVRWQHPTRGLLMPAEFIPVAEAAGLLGRIGEWVIAQACRQAVVWRDLFPDRRIPVSVNVAASQLQRPGLAAFVKRVLRETGLDPWLLELEVTESALREDEPGIWRELRELKALGARLIVDDFGAGYSSLSALRNLGIDGLKLDRSFVQGLEHDGDQGAMVKAVLTLAGAIDADVTAEGVETNAQVSRLRMQGCDFAQGYLFAPPAPAADLTALIAEGAEHGAGCDAERNGFLSERGDEWESSLLLAAA
jgi:Amt family ammonium transporter